MRRTFRTLNDCEMQHNAEVGLFTKPSINKSFHSSVFMLSHPSFLPGPPVKFDGPKLSRIVGVCDIRLCLGVLCLKSQIPSTKLQINIKFQYSMTKTIRDEALFGISNFGHWTLFDICDLIFVIFELPINQIPTGIKQSLVLCTRILYFDEVQ
jgi:hypothetical protein